MYEKHIFKTHLANQINSLDMKTILLLCISFFFSLNIFTQTFINPINYVGDEFNDEKVVLFIKERVKDNAIANNIFDKSQIRKMESKNLKAFKKLTKVTNTELLESLIKEYSKYWYYNYSEILTLYMWEEKNRKKNHTYTKL